VVAAETLFDDFSNAQAPILVMGTNRPHDPVEFVDALRGTEFLLITATAADWPRAIAAEEAERLAEEDDTPVPFATPEVNVDDLVGAAIAVPSDNNKSIAALLGAVAAFLFLLPFRKKEELPLFTCINLLDPQGP
jgi:hypothetical protein